jgi:[ribosomal protein S5]-alanine N-acetyltransferase
MSPTSPARAAAPAVTLRHVTESDMPLLIRAVTDPAWRGAFLPSRITSPATMWQRFRENGFSGEDMERLMIVNAEGRVVGDVVHFPAHRYSTAREIGWSVFDPADRNQGYGAAGARALVDYLFRSLPIHRLCCSLSPDNLASARVAQKAGFHCEGLMRGVVFCAGEYLDGEFYGMTRDDWRMAGQGGS